MPTILLDIDGVLADFEGAVRRTCAEVGHDLAAVTAHNFTDNLPALIYAHYVGASTQFGWCSAIEPYVGAYAFVADLRTLGDVVAVTAPLRHCPTWESERRAWLLKHVGIRDVVSTRRKDLVWGDVLVEDNEDNLRAWWKRWAVRPGARASKMGILVRHTYNTSADWPTCVPARDFNALYEAVRRAVG